MCSYVYLFVLWNTETHVQNRNVRRKDLVYVCSQHERSEIWNGFLRDTITVIPRVTKIIRSGITFVSRNVISRRFL